MPPFGREPGVVEVQPADDGADIESGLHRIKLKGCSRNPGAVRNDRSRNDRTQELCTSGISQRFKTAAQRVQQTIVGRFPGKIISDLIIKYIIGDIDKNLIGLGPFVRVR